MNSTISRTSHEVRGLKDRITGVQGKLVDLGVRRSTRNEMYLQHRKQKDYPGRTSHEVRGLKFLLTPTENDATACRTSHEVRGLK